jgi:peptide-methionine (S)-S-oxide reductase
MPRLVLTLAAAAFVLISPALAQKRTDLAVATFAGGCFWCMEEAFEKVEGVVTVVSGFMGGKTPNPTYSQVSRGNTGHAEVVQVSYDPTKVSYDRLLFYFWRNVDLLDKDGQFCDRGSEYRPEIFAHGPEQKAAAEASRQALADSGRFRQPIVVPVSEASTFTAAEAYHQDFYKTNPLRYFSYKAGCGRMARLEGLWGKEAGGKTAPTN